MATALVLGSGAALPAKGRFNTTLAILEGARTVLVDCASPASELLYHHGVDYTSVDTVVITHMHADHVTGIGQLAHMKHHFVDAVHPRAFFDRQDPFFKDNLRFPPRDKWTDVNSWLTIYVPEGVEDSIRQYMKALYMRPEVFTKFEVRVLPYGGGEVHRDELFKITAYPNVHIRHYYPELRNTDAMLSSNTILVEVGGRTCLYSSDVAGLKEIEGIVRKVDTVFVEGAHPTPREILQFAQRLDLKRVFVLHIHAPHEEEFARLKDELARANVTLTYDGFEVDL